MGWREGWREARKEGDIEISTYITYCMPLLFAAILSQDLGKTLFFSFFHFSLIFYFLNGSLDSLLVSQELVRPNSAQVLIQFQENGDTGRKSDVDDVFV